jgi:hypothetical protein
MVHGHASEPSLDPGRDTLRKSQLRERLERDMKY